MNQDLIIRRYLPSDEDVVVDLWSNAASEAHPFLVGEGTGDREQKMREVYLIQADNWVAEHNSEVVGLLGMIGSEIGGLFVAPASQGLGVGRALVEHATTMHDEVTLEVYTLNDRARRFYALMEFEEEGRRLDVETNHEIDHPASYGARLLRHSAMRDTDEPSTGLTLCTDLAATDWLVDQDLPWYQLAGRGPIGFPKYARLRFIPDPSFPGQKSNDVDFDQTGPEEKVLIGFALDVLSSYTTTPDECYFCMWTGWGSAVGDDVPRFEIPNRDYWLLRGTLADYADWSVENSVRWPWGSSPDPAFIWPADHAWCITNDVDPHFAIIAAPEEAIIRIVADSRIDAVLDDPDIVPPYWH